MSIAHRSFRKYTALLPFYLLMGMLILILFALANTLQPSEWQVATSSLVDSTAPISSMQSGLPSKTGLYVSAPLSFTVSFTTYFPLIAKPVADLKSLISEVSITLPHPLATNSRNWCM